MGQGNESSKELSISGKVAFLWGMAGIYQKDYFTSADQEIPD